MTGDPRASGQLGHMGFFAKCRQNFPSAFCCPAFGSVYTAWMSQADCEAAGRGSKEGGGTEEATAILGMALSPRARPCRASLWTAYKAWWIFLFMQVWPKRNKSMVQSLLPLNPSAYIFQMIIHFTHPPSTPRKAGLLKKKHLIW